MGAAGRSPTLHRALAARLAACSLLVLLLLSTACTRRSAAPGPPGNLQIRIESESHSVGLSRLTLLVTDESDEPVTGANVTVRGDMSHAGMVPVLAEAVETDPGLYRTELEWTMAGDWIVTVTVGRPGHEAVEQQFDLSVAGPGG